MIVVRKLFKIYFLIYSIMTKIRFAIPPGLYDYSYGMPRLIRSMYGLSNEDESLDKST